MMSPIPEWMDNAACRGEQRAWFFPPASLERKDERLRREARAKAVCADCAVRATCLDWALANHEAFGIWGGLNEAERRVMGAA